MISKGKIILVTKRYSIILLLIIGAILILGARASYALGLGEIRVRSSLGQNLLAHSEILGSDFETLNPSCLRARINTIDGVFLTSANITVFQRQNKRALSFTTRQAINEPAIVLIIDINCETQLHREFSILLDPPEATQSFNAQARDESPFAGVPNDSSKEKSALDNESSNLKVAASSRFAKKKTQVESLSFDKEIQKNPISKAKIEAKKVAKPARDVLKLSDEVVLPNLPSGLRMSDVLTTQSGQALVQNMEELRVAQTRMAALLKDEVPNAEVQASAPATSKPNDLLEIANLKRETEILRRQSANDRIALDELQKKSQFDLWFILLGAIAIVAILVILFLLVYIRKNLNEGRSTWWEGTQAMENEDHDVEAVISELQSEFDAKPSSGFKSSEKIVTSRGAAAKQEDEFIDTTTPIISDSGFHRTPTLEETNSSIFNFFSPRGSSVKVEEISDVTQEAEFWISMNDPLRAIEILQGQEKVEHPDSPVPWLFLLDLYRTVNDAERYNALRDRFIVHFNANIPEYDADLTVLQFRNLEDFEHLIGRICALWGSHEVIPFLESLLVDDREGKRAGFDLPVYRDILMLLGIAHELERLRSLDTEMQNMLVNTRRAEPEPITPDPVNEAEFGTIEFESIDFPAIDLSKVKKAT